MSKKIKHIILYLAYALLLLHNLTPHQHHDELSAAEHEREHTSTNILDFLRTIFHNDFGNQYHLDNYELEKTKSADKAFIIADFDNEDIDNQHLNIPFNDFEATVSKPFFIGNIVAIAHPPPLLHCLKYTIPISFKGFSVLSLRAPPCA
jgi:hypothetical protein